MSSWQSRLLPLELQPPQVDRHSRASRQQRPRFFRGARLYDLVLSLRPPWQLAARQLGWLSLAGCGRQAEYLAPPMPDTALGDAKQALRHARPAGPQNGVGLGRPG